MKVIEHFKHSKGVIILDNLAINCILIFLVVDSKLLKAVISIQNWNLDWLLKQN